MEHLDFALKIAKKAGKIMRSNFKIGMTKVWKDDHSPLTATDLAINKLVIDSVKKTFPNHSVIAEEGSLDIKGKEYIWVCDPVDGTLPFSHGVPTAAFSLALTKNGESILGVVCDPFMNRLLYAEKGKGAFMNGNPINVSTNTTLAHTALNVDGPINDNYYSLSSLPKLLDIEKAKITKFSSLVYGGMLVALGEYSGAVCTGKYPWDIAALKVIVEEAGGKVTNIYGKDQLYNQQLEGALITNGLIHDRLLQLVSESLSNKK